MDMSLEAFIDIVGPQSEELINSFINAKTKIQIQALEIKADKEKRDAEIKLAEIELAKINASKSQVIFF